MEVTFKFKYHFIGGFWVDEQAKFVGQCVGFEQRPECNLVYVPARPPTPRSDQFGDTWRVLDTDNDQYIILVSNLKINWVGIKYTSETLILLTKEQAGLQDAELVKSVDAKITEILKGRVIAEENIKVYDHVEEDDECDN